MSIPLLSHYCPMIIQWLSYDYPIIILWLHDYPYWTTWKTITSPAITVPSCWSQATPLRSTPLPSPLPHSMDTMLLCAWPAPCAKGSQTYGKTNFIEWQWFFLHGRTIRDFHMVENIFLIIQQSLDIPCAVGWDSWLQWLLILWGLPLMFLRVRSRPSKVHRGNMIFIGILGYNDKW